MADEIKKEIFDELCEFEDDGKISCDEMMSIYNKVDILQIQLEDKMESSLRDVYRKINEKEQEIQQMREERIKMNFIRIGMFKYRKLLNMLFPRLWSIYKATLENTNYHELADKTSIMKRKYIVDKDIGSKFALAIIHKVDPSIIFPINVCEYYITLNDDFHPKAHPINVAINEIVELGRIVKSLPIDNSIGISVEVIDNSIEQFLKYESELKI